MPAARPSEAVIRNALEAWKAAGLLVMAHTQAKTSEVCTRGAERRVLSATAMQAMRGVEW